MDNFVNYTGQTATETIVGLLGAKVKVGFTGVSKGELDAARFEEIERRILAIEERLTHPA